MLFKAEEVEVPAAILDGFGFLQRAVRYGSQRSPGGKARAFCEDVSTMSNPQASVSILAPLNEETASTRMSVSGAIARTASATSLTGFCNPVEVSLWTMLRASNPPLLMAAATRSGSTGWSHSKASFSTSLPFETATSCQRSAKAPLTQESTFLSTRLRMAASCSPVPEDALKRTRCLVRNTSCAFSDTRRKISSNSLLRCGSIGSAWA